MTRFLHTARISDVVSFMFVNRIRNMVSFKLGKETEKDVFRLVTSVEQRKNYEDTSRQVYLNSDPLDTNVNNS